MEMRISIVTRAARDRGRLEELVAKLRGLGIVPDGPITERLGSDGDVVYLRETCSQPRRDPQGRALDERCGRPYGHDDPGVDCGDWLPSMMRCPECGRSETEHLRDYQDFSPRCMAWPPTLEPRRLHAQPR